jgi:xanthine dehydrogenase molybdenum-binding subunit
MAIIGKPLPHIDAVEKVTGKAMFTRDVSAPGMLYAGALRSPYASAIITSIDTSKAEALPGVEAVATYKDFWMKNPTPYLAGTTYWALDNIVRFYGYEVAAVAAVDRKTVLQALDLITVQYQQLPVIKTIDDALAPGAHEVHAGTKNIAIAGGNPAVTTVGDINAGLSQADVVIDKIFTTSMSQHKAQPEPASWLAMWTKLSDGSSRLEVWEKNKRLQQDRDEMATILGVPASNVVIHGSYVGGDYGNRSYSRGPFIAAVLSRKSGLPVKFEDSAEEHSFNEGPRQRGRFEIKIGAKKDGTLTALYGKFLWDIGAFGSSGPSTATMGYLLYAYEIPNAYGEHWPVFTNNPPTSGFRGYGRMGPQAALETTLNELAQTLGMDPIELRRKNLRVPPEVNYDGSAQLDKLIQVSGWKTKWTGWGKPYSVSGSKVRAVGMAATGHHGGSIGGTWSATVRYTVDGKIILGFGTTEQGAGNHTGMAMIAAEAAGVNYPADVIFPMPQDSSWPRAPSESANSATVAYGWPCMQAALDAKGKLLALAATSFNTTADQLDVRSGSVFQLSNPSNKKTISSVLGGSEVIGSASVARPMRSTHDQSFHAAVAEIELDTSTGKITILNLFTTHDIGQPLNPGMLESGARGAVGSFGLEFSKEPLDVCDPTSLARLTYPTGTPGNDSPTISDFWSGTSWIHQPTYLVTPNPLGPYGALGASEGPHTHIAPAIIDAVSNAIGVRFYQAPLTFDVVLKALGKI